MIKSYIMIDHLGRFYQNTENTYYFSRLILKVGIVNALKDIKLNRKMFINRYGVYAWWKKNSFEMEDILNVFID